jgi:diaminopimelate epimerase
MKYAKYHALGNDYIVIRPAELQSELVPDVIRLVCHRNYGVGSDGILLGPLDSQACDFRLRIFNPDGTEAEKAETACASLHGLFGMNASSVNSLSVLRRLVVSSPVRSALTVRA